MILCQECGNSAPSRDGFCSSCGALLDWSGERVETTVSPGATPPVNVPAAAPPAPLEAPGRLPSAETRRTGPVPLATEPEFTGPYCQACGARNPEGRRFCRSCGGMLQLPAVAEPHRGWWRRLIGRLSGRRREFAAGERPTGFRDHHAANGAGAAAGQGAAGTSRRKGLRLPRHIKLGRLAPLLLLAGLAGVGLGPARSWVSTEVSTVLGKAKARVSEHYVNVTPVGATADAEKGHAAGLAVDGINTTYWASAKHPDGVGDTITVTFASPVDIDQIGVLSGADAQNFRALARPRELTVSAGGAPASVLTFDDTGDFQNRGIALRHVTTVTFTVKDCYPGQKQHDLAIRDIEFFVKSSGA